MKTSLLLFTTLVLAGPLLAESIEIPPNSDTTIDQAEPVGNFGRETALRVRNAPGSETRALLRFNIGTSVPPGSTITSVSLNLAPADGASSSGPARLALYRVARVWNEGRGSVAAGIASEAHEASWSRRLHPVAIWIRPGGARGIDFVSGASGSVDLGTGVPVVFPSTKRLVSDVQDWLDRPFSNEGWIVVAGSNSDPAGLVFGSREDAARAPKLTIEFTPPSADPATASAEYEVVFRATWSPASHPREFPLSAHWSALVGGLHNESISFWRRGAAATEGIRRMAELGTPGTLSDEVTAAITAGTANRVLLGTGISRGAGRSSIRFTIDRSHPLVTLTSMVAPSPDWFVGVRNLPLVERGRWVARKIVPLFPYDAGTDSGTTFSSPNEVTDPFGVISRIATAPLAGRRGNVIPMGYMDFRRITPPRGN